MAKGNNNNRGTSYSFFNTVSAVSVKNGTTFFSVTVAGTLSRVETKKTQTGKAVVNASMAINGRSKYINSLFDTHFGDDETVWAKISIWEERAERFMNMRSKMGNPDKIKLILVGSITPERYTRRDKSEGECVKIAVQDWMLLPSKDSKQQNAGNIPAQPTSDYSDLPDGFTEFGDDDTEDDLPF